ncbi:MAG TPA: DNA-directed RNA polymerase subunit omega [Longimicrobiaceae bacterium]|nr:DNA-directed RNA polymerase subunit omega [Longimicrobiaceae bacterium]
MRVVTPGAAARTTGSKYLGVLVAAKYARNLNELRRGEMMEDPTVSGTEPREKLTTISLEEVAAGTVDFHLTQRVRPDAL